MSPAALVFDFDGTILDTETPIYEAWKHAYVEAGTEPIALDVWAEQIGLADEASFDVRAELCTRLGVDSLPARIEQARRRVRDELLAAQQVREGVLEWIDAARARGVTLAIASSSSSSWVAPHLARLGLTNHFRVVSCADPGIPGKPDPTVYLTACRGVGASPGAALAIEDSAHGVTAAVTAGMRCVAAPGPITRNADFAHASTRVDSLADLDPADWL